MKPNHITALDTALTTLFPVRRQWRGASEVSLKEKTPRYGQNILFATC